MIPVCCHAGQGSRRLLALVLGALLAGAAAGRELRLEVWSPSPAIGEAGAGALAGYLGAATGVAVAARVAPSALAHWERTCCGPRYEIVLDAAHFTGYRERRFGFVVLAKLAGETSYAVVTAPGTVATSLDDLLGSTLAVPPAPGLAGVLARRLFPDPLRGPRLLDAADLAGALEALAAGRAGAALLPSPQVPRAARARILVETEALPGPAVSVSPGLAAALRRRIGVALARAPPSILAALATPALEEVAPGRYAPYAILLEGTWGYRVPRHATPRRHP